MKQKVTVAGCSPDKRIVEMIEVVDHPYFVGTQGHPEFKSRPNHAHPLFRGLVTAAAAICEGKITSQERMETDE